MKNIDLLSGNHDIHMHSRNFSDGAHDVLDLVPFTARWQKDPRWVGLSDHSPRTVNEGRHYIDSLHSFQQKASQLHGITLLAGMELEWNPTLPAVSDLDLDGLDYVIAAYHGMNFSTAEQVEEHYGLVACHPFSDAAAHPDRFLGEIDPLAVDWEKIFNDFSSHKVMCEYNLTTPLHPDILAVAKDRTEVNFVIGSDTHDFRNIAARRIIDAWSEMLGGGYELAREYLISLLKLNSSSRQISAFSKLFENSRLLNDLQRKVYRRSLDPESTKGQFSEEDEKLLKVLADTPECEEDKIFLIRRLERFARLPAKRIISLLDIKEFKSAIVKGRNMRQEW